MVKVEQIGFMRIYPNGITMHFEESQPFNSKSTEVDFDVDLDPVLVSL